MFIEIIKSIILGIVQGITEWLPISSTGHMILVDEFLVLNTSPAFKEMFLVVIQLASILAVIIIFFKKLNPFDADKNDDQKKKHGTFGLKLLSVSFRLVFLGYYLKIKSMKSSLTGKPCLLL